MLMPDTDNECNTPSPPQPHSTTAAGPHRGAHAHKKTGSRSGAAYSQPPAARLRLEHLRLRGERGLLSTMRL